MKKSPTPQSSLSSSCLSITCLSLTKAKVIGDKKSGRLLGLHIVDPSASEMIGEGVLAIEQKATVNQLASAPHAHPTLSEVIKEAALNALGRAIHL